MATLTAKQYREIFDHLSGDNVARIKRILEQYSSRWEWDGGDSIIIDLLDDRSCTAEDMLEMLAEAIEFDELNQEGKNAYLAMKLALKRQQVLSMESLTFDMQEMGDESVDHFNRNLPNYLQDQV